MAVSTVIGLIALSYALDGLCERVLKPALVAGMAEGAKTFQEAAQSHVPSQSGALRDSIQTHVQQTGTVVRSTVTAGGPTAPYAAHVEFGTAAHIERPVNGKALAFGGGEFAEIHHPGAQAKPFMRLALDTAKDAAVAAVVQHVSAALKGSAR